MTFPIPPLSSLAVDFFAMFARIEYSMKRSEQYRTTKKGYLEADWSVVHESGELKSLYENVKEDASAKELIGLPPKSPILVGEGFTWGDQPPTCKCTKDLIRALKNVRNNLLHGNKGKAEDDRDRKLFHAGIFVMNCILEHSPTLRDNYYF